MIRLLMPFVLLFMPALVLAAPAAEEEIDALSLLAGARELLENGVRSNASSSLNDGLPTEGSQWEPQKQGETLSIFFELAEPFDLTRGVVVNSFNEASYPGISVKKLRLEYGPTLHGPWKPLSEVSLKKGNAPQKFAFKEVKGVRYLRLTLLENYGEKEWWSLAELSVFGRRSKPRAKVEFNGFWDTSYGPMRLEQKGERITGCYGDGSYLVEGTVEGPIFFGTYVEGETRGAMAFALTAEGDISGVYGSNLNATRDTRWDGEKAANLTLKCAARKDDLSDELKEHGRVVLRGIYFDTGKDLIKSESLPTLEALAKAIKEGGETAYVIEGHTDDRGGATFNQGLSGKRAASVKKWLTEHGVDGKALKTIGYGQSRPAMPSDSEAGRAANRRVEVAVEK